MSADTDLDLVFRNAAGKKVTLNIVESVEGRMTEISADGSGQRGTAAFYFRQQVKVPAPVQVMADQVAGNLPLRDGSKIFQGNDSGRK